MSKRIGLVTGGGDCPGLNAVIRSVAKAAAQRGWDAATVSCWLIVDEGRTNRRRLDAHRHVMRLALPDDGRRAVAWLRHPEGRLAAVSVWPYATQTGVPPTCRQRVRRSGANRRAIERSDGSARR